MTATDNKNSAQKLKRRKIINERFLFFGFMALLFGITLSRKLFAGDTLYIVITVVSLFFLILGLSLTKHFKMLVVIVALFFAGCGLFFAGQATFVGKTFDAPCAVVGRVSDDITQYDNRISVKLDNVYINGKRDDNIYLNVYNSSSNFSLQAGQTVSFESEINNVRLYNLGEFNSFYYRKNTPYMASVNASALTFTDGDLHYDEVIRLRVNQMLHENMSQENADICFAVLFGDKSGIDESIKFDFNKVGVIHILTVSGLHVGFLVGLLYFLLKKSNRYVRAAVITLILILYNILCGFAPSIMRASIMALVMLFAKLFNRQYDSLTALSLAGFIIILARPLYAFDLGFLMSFFCVLGIILLNRRIFNIFSKFLPSFAAKYFAITISAQIGILPFVADMFAGFNILSIFANLIIIPIISVLLPLAFVIMVITLVMPFLAPLFHVVDCGFAVMVYVIKLFASTNAVVYLRPTPLIANIFFALSLFAVSYILMIKRVWRTLLVGCLLIGACLTVILTNLGGVGSNTMLYLNTQTCPVLYAVNEKGESLLVCESLDKNLFDEYAYRCGIKQIDYIVTLDNDLGGIVESFKPKCVVYPNLLTQGQQSEQIDKEQIVEIGNFKVNYRYIDEKLAGIDIKINNFENFFATSDFLSYNIKDKLSQELNSNKLSFCFLNKQTGLTLDGVAFSSYKSQSIFSLYGFGNMKISLAGSTYNLRSID